MSLAEKIKTLRLKKGLSQLQLAQALGVSRQAEAKWENGTTAPDILKIKDLAALLGTTADALLSEEPMEDAPCKTTKGSERITLRMLEGEEDEMTNFMKSLGYLPLPEKAEGGSLVLLHPLASLEKQEPLSYLSLSYALPLDELTNKDKTRLRQKFLSSLSFEGAWNKAKQAQKELRLKHHPARGILYVTFSAFDIPCIAFSIVLARLSRWFYVLSAFLLFLFFFLLIQGIRWIKKPNANTYPKQFAAYEDAKNQLSALSETTQDIYDQAMALSSSKASSTNDPLEQIQKAKELLDQGALTEEEFLAIKKKALGNPS